MARKGLIGADYKRLLVQLGMSKRGAGKAAQAVQRLLSSAKGIGGMWKAFSEDLPREGREPGVAERYSLKGVRKALQDLLEQAKSARVMIGADDRVFTKQYKSGNKLRWLQEYDGLRARGLGMRTAMKGAYEVVRKAVKEAERERGDRKAKERGVKALFERQRRLQEAQARQQALARGVASDEANGSHQNGVQAQRSRGHRGVQRSLQEEWDIEEDSVSPYGCVRQRAEQGIYIHPGPRQEGHATQIR